jgi:cytochrome P450
MIAHPDVQRRAQEQLDRVVGRFRPPTFADAPNLPYIQALIKETLRWRPVLPLSIPHSAIADDWYEGWFIPKGTICFPNVWLCNHDPAYYGDDAESFNPERFLDEHGKLIQSPAEVGIDGHSAFGFGRRICVGTHAANDTLFISIAMVLWAMRLECPCDENGKEVVLDTETTVDIGTVLYVTVSIILFFWACFRPSTEMFLADRSHTCVMLFLGSPRHRRYSRSS